MIDTLKLVNQRLLNLIEDTDEDDNDLSDLLLYFKVSKFTYLADSSFLEDLALECDFNIEELPTLSFDKVNNELKIDVLNEANGIFYFYIFNELDALCEISEKKGALNTYLALTGLSRVEVLLNFLDKETFNDVFNYFQEKYGNLKIETMDSAKRLIRKRKEEFN